MFSSYCNATFIAFIICAVALHSHAITLHPTNWNRGDANTTYQEWDFFSFLTNNPPDYAHDNPNGTPDVSVNGNPADYFLTSGANIYSTATTPSISINLPDYGLGQNYYTTVVFQLRVQGSPINPDSIQLTYNDNSNSNSILPASTATLASQDLGGFGGTLEDTWYRFDIPFNPAQYTINFAGFGPHMSTDIIVVDSIVTTAQQGFVPENVVPEPASFLSVSIVALALLRVRTKRAA